VNGLKSEWQSDTLHIISGRIINLHLHSKDRTDHSDTWTHSIRLFCFVHCYGYHKLFSSNFGISHKKIKIKKMLDGNERPISLHTTWNHSEMPEQNLSSKRFSINNFQNCLTRQLSRTAGTRLRKQYNFIVFQLCALRCRSFIK